PHYHDDQPILHSLPTRRSSDLNLSKHTRSYNLEGFAIVWTTALPLTGLNHLTSFLLGLNHDSCLFNAVGNRLFNVDVLAGIDSIDRKSTRLNSSHVKPSYAVFC